MLGDESPLNGSPNAPFLVPKPRQSRGRFQALTIFSLLSLTNAFFWIGFAPIEQLTSDFYGVNAAWVNLLSALFSAPPPAPEQPRALPVASSCPLARALPQTRLRLSG